MTLQEIIETENLKKKIIRVFIDDIDVILKDRSDVSIFNKRQLNKKPTNIKQIGPFSYEYYFV